MSRQSLDWWFWLAQAGLLTVGLAGNAWAFGLAAGLMAARAVQLTWHSRGLTGFAVQVHAAFLLLSLAGLAPGLDFIHWNLAAGTWLLVGTDYCILARLLSLLPWNRSGPLSWRLVGRTFVSPPATNIADSLSRAAPASAETGCRGSAAVATDGTPAGGINGFLETLALWRRRSHTRGVIASFDQRMLKDIGVGYYDAWQESRKWFWQR